MTSPQPAGRVAALRAAEIPGASTAEIGAVAAHNATPEWTKFPKPAPEKDASID
jgi:hypothetical protein